MASIFKKIKESLKFSVNPIKYLHEEAKAQGTSDTKLFKQTLQKAQKYSPSSKYLGFSGVRGVESQKEIKTQTADTEQANFQAQAQAQATEAGAQDQARREQAAQLAARRRNKLFAYGTDRSNTLGGAGPSGSAGKTLLGY